MDYVTEELGQMQPEPPQHERHAVTCRLDELKRAETHYRRTFDQMRKDMAFARGKQWPDGSKGYVVNMTLRHLQMRRAALYAKNPTVDIKIAQKIDSAVWDGSAGQLIAAQAELQQGGMMGAVNPEALAIIQEAEAVQKKRHFTQRLARSLSAVLKYSMDDGVPTFKEMAKECVGYALTCGVGWAKIGFHRPGDGEPDAVARANDIADRQAMADSLPESATEDQQAAAGAYLEASAMDAQGQEMAPEGLTFTFPSPTSVIVDPKTRSLCGLQGARWVAEKFCLSRQEIKSIYGVDLRQGDYTEHRFDGVEFAYKDDGPLYQHERDRASGAIVYEVWDREKGTVETVCAGHKGYLRAPEPPPVRVDGFFPYAALMFNWVPDDENIYPPSDVELMRDMQIDTNLARQGLREHRVANRPRQLMKSGLIEEEEIKRASTSAAHHTIPVNAPAGTPIDQILVPFPTVPIKAELYDTSVFEQDMLKAVGTQEANIGPTSGATATEVGVAEASRQTSMASQMDDVDLWLTRLMRHAGKIALENMSEQRAKEIAGDAAFWPAPQFARMANDLLISIKAGSSGKPNRAMEIANFERLGPLLLQLPGINPAKLAEEMLSRLGDTLEIDELLDPASPSIIALNSMMNAGPMLSAGNAAGSAPDANPTAQGDKGSNNLPAGIGRPGGPQPGRPQIPMIGG